MTTTTIAPTTTTIPPLLENYVAELRRTGKSANTIKAYRIDLVEFSKWYCIRTNHDFNPSALDSQDVVDYRTFTLAQNLKSASINRRLTSIRKFFDWAVATKLIPANPLEAIHKLLVKDQNQQTAPKWLDRNQQLALLREVRKGKNLRDYAIFQTFLGTGLRISELAVLTLDDVEINERSGWVRVRSGKGTKSREIPLDLKTRQAIEEYKGVRPTSASNRLFLGQRGPTNPEGINYLVAEYARRAGLDCTPHTLRHSYAKTLVDAGIPLDQVATLMGHESLDTTKIYTKPSRADLEQAVRKAAGEIL